MIKTKVIQSVIFSFISFFLILFGALLMAGVFGNATEGTDKLSLTTVGELGAGLVSVSILVILWSLAIVLPTFTTWQNKSPLLLTILICTIVFMPFTMITGIVYSAMGLHNKEDVTVKAKKEVEA